MPERGPDKSLNGSLPAGWAETFLGEIAFPDRPRESPADYPDLPFIGMEHVDAHSMRLLGTVSASTMKSSAVHFKPNDVLYGRLRPYLNKVLRPIIEGLCSAEFIVFSDHGHINQSWLAYRLNSSDLVSFAAHQNEGDRPRVDYGQISPFRINLPPRPEQDRIVAEIEKQFTRLDDAVAALKRVQANLKRYRASVLKAACEGRLVPTEAELARKEGRDYEPASELLKRILAERRAKWEAHQLKKMIAAGKPPKDEWKSRYEEPQKPNAPTLPELPAGWTWATIDQVAECLDGKRVPVNKEERAKRLGEIPYYGANGRVGWIDDFLFDEPLVLVVEDETFVGRTIPFSYLITGKSWVNNHAHVLRPSAGVIPAYLNYSLMFYPFTPLTTGSTGRRKLTQKALMAASYPLPPLQEQTRIVSQVERLISTVDNVLSICDLGHNRAAVLRKAVLDIAFSGKLVPQDPNDEPASVLLERIRAERVRAQEQKEKTPRVTNGASSVNGQRRRRGTAVAQRVNAGKG